jgi:peptidoglycan-N-acetylglucosamine deacetylase
MPFVTLSFDNGPEPEATPHVLDVLAKHGIRTTFFVIGNKLETGERRRLSERARDEGHWIGNHTYTHTTPLGLSPDPAVAEAEIGRTQRALGALAHPDRLFRPFGGGGNLDRRLMTAGVRDYLVQGGYTCVLWNAIPRDWDDPDGWVGRALAQAASRAWSLMVLHDLPSGAMRHLETFIDRAKDAGVSFRQEFPPDCVPILRGEIVRALEAYVADDTPAPSNKGEEA